MAGRSIKLMILSPKVGSKIASGLKTKRSKENGQKIPLGASNIKLIAFTGLMQDDEDVD